MSNKNKEEETCCICLQYLKIHKDPSYIQQQQQLSKQQSQHQQNQEKYSYHVSKPDSCQHKFHKSCIVTWLQQNTACPICQNEILWINVTIPPEQLNDYKIFRQQLHEENKNKNNSGQQNKEKQQQQQKEQDSEDEQEQDEWSHEIKKSKKGKLKKDDFPSLGQGEEDFPGLPMQKEEVFQQLPKENEELLKKLSEDQQSTIQGDKEIITIQEINNYCKVYFTMKQDEEVKKQEYTEEDELSAFEMIQLKELQHQENTLEFIDHNFLKNEHSGLLDKYEEVLDLMHWNKIDLKKYEKSYKDPHDFFWFVLDEIHRKMNKIKQIFTKMYKFDCQKIMLDIDQIDKELDWARREKLDFLFDQYEFNYKKYIEKQQEKLIYDYQTDKIQKLAPKKKSSDDFDELDSPGLSNTNNYRNITGHTNSNNNNRHNQQNNQNRQQKPRKYNQNVNLQQGQGPNSNANKRQSKGGGKNSGKQQKPSVQF